MNIELAHPLLLLLAPLPLLVYWLSPGYKTRRSAIKVPFFTLLLEVMAEKAEKGASILPAAIWQRAALILAWLLMVLAAAKPMWLGAPQQLEQYGRDVMVVVDLSGSMETRDFTSESGDRISRLEAVKQVLHDFSASRENDRLGLILFADAAFVQAPFTADHRAWLSLLDEAQVPMAGKSTHLGDALGLAIKVLLENDANRAGEAPEKLAIVLTDGNDTDSYIPPGDAAQLARARGVKMHIVAMGDPETVGENAIDMESINEVARATGGQAFQALDSEQLGQAYDVINELEPTLYKSISYQPKTSLHPYLVMVVVLLYLSAFSLALLRRRFHGEPRHD
ncbi:VWA domain-containing protein [Marinobacterium nitratireducens]|uniref:VWA domain-containing protein n=1 Tax=Marinobacterium nitratireducens TaxID=518897 RepID=A0A917ZCB3_9GAMM|nr:VWA domain-containing protein [Marinobacterium nitratireducens]GGO78942.1 VWA domain-containing protein [Marinobacterium nitratireducens]